MQSNVYVIAWTQIISHLIFIFLVKKKKKNWGERGGGPKMVEE